MSMTDSVRVPPHSLDAEVSVLGSVLLDNDTLINLRPLLSPESFYREGHRKIYAAMLHLSNADQPVDLVTLSTLLDTRGDLADIGGSSYLIGLSESVPTAVYAEYYARIVAEKHTLRQLIQASGKVLQLAYEPGDMPVAEVVDKAQETMTAIALRRPSDELISDSTRTMHETVNWLVSQHTVSLSTGFYDLDRALAGGFSPEDLVIIGARPRIGKTAFALNLAENAARNEPEKDVLFFCLEMNNVELGLRRVAAEARVSLHRMRDSKSPDGQPLSESDLERITNAASRLADSSLHIISEPGLTVNDICRISRAHTQKTGRKISLIVVDYLQMLETDSGGNPQNRARELGQSAYTLKALGRQLGCTVLLLSQLSRKVEDRPNHRPVLSDLAESGGIEAAGNVVILLYRDEIYNPDTDQQGIAEIIIGKQRNGPPKTVKLQYHGEHVRFNNLEQETMLAL